MNENNETKSPQNSIVKRKRNSRRKTNFVPINLNDILTNNEISELEKSSEFNPVFGVSNQQEEQVLNYEKDELIMKIISMAISKSEKYNERTLAKCLRWVKKELQMNLQVSPDVKSIQNLTDIGQNEPEFKESLGWMKQYSDMNRQLDIYYCVGKFANKLKNKINNKIFKYSRQKSIEETTKLLSKDKSFLEKYHIDLAKIDTSEFNIFELEKSIGEINILPVLGTYALSSMNSFNAIDYNSFSEFVYKVASGYHRTNPYHNDLHAADMTQTLLVYLLQGNIKVSLNLNTLDIASLLISAMIHDYAHPGLTNNFLINTKNELAIKYNDQSVLENYHVSAGFNIILNEKNCNIFRKLSVDDYKFCRKRIINCVLATDMTNHNRLSQFLNVRIASFNIKKGENLNQIFEGLDLIADFNIKQEFLNVIIHAADISNPTKPLEIYKIWAKKCVDEFFLQGDKEREMGLPVSFNCDRNTVSLPKSQIGFIDAIVSPLFEVMNEFFPKLQFTLSNLNKNKEYFQELISKEEKDKVKVH